MSIVESLQKAGRYELAERLGYNGVVATYKAFQRDTQQYACVVAIDQRQVEQPAAWQTFSDDVTRLIHGQASRLCQPLSFGAEPGYYWAAFESLKGNHLGNEVRTKGLPGAARSLEIMAQTVEGLQVLQANGMAHRIVSPASIFINDIGQVKLLHAAWGGLILGVQRGAANPAFISNLPFLSPE
ncbi:hypothetical protein HZA57_01605, partial [Candidatus Poribacteria bacterium]|nr:hypothetical protein [Candidatus Poribacteria bacterium]